MKANTAVGFILLSLASYLLINRNAKIKNVIGIFFAAGVIIFSLLTVSQYLFNVDFKIDELLFLDPGGGKKWPPGRFAPVTGINFIFIGTALILHTFNRRKFVKFTQGLAVIAWVISFQALVGYISGITYSFGSAFYTQIALHTTFLFISLTTANLLLWRNEGYLKHISRDNVSGIVGRKLLIAAVVVPPIVNLISIHGVKWNIYDEDFGVLIRVIGNVVCFAWMAMTTSKYLSEVDDKRAVAELAQKVRTEELQRALQARDDLLSICSHELRTPISSMKLQTQFVKYQMEKGDPSAFAQDKVLAMVEQSDRQLDRLTKLIEDMLDFSRINSGRFNLSKEEFDLHKLIINVLDSFKMQLQASHCQVILSMESEEPILVYWDSYRIEQLLSNLINNALKYGSHKPIKIHISNNPKETCIQVADQGMGIAENDHQRIFEAYERAVSVAKISGLGLGLFISKKIVEAHGGSISVESFAGIGSTFTTVIPNRVVDNIEGSSSYAI